MFFHMSRQQRMCTDAVCAFELHHPHALPPPKHTVALSTAMNFRHSCKWTSSLTNLLTSRPKLMSSGSHLGWGSGSSSGFRFQFWLEFGFWFPVQVPVLFSGSAWSTWSYLWSTMTRFFGYYPDTVCAIHSKQNFLITIFKIFQRHVTIFNNLQCRE